MQHTYRDALSMAPNSVWTCQWGCLLVLLPFFVSPLPHQQNVSLWELFSSGETNTQKKSLGERSGEEGGGAWGSWPFLVKNWWTLSTVWAGVLLNHPSWNGQTRWESLQKNFTEAKCSLSQHHQLVHWHRWVPRTLTSQGKPGLQGARPLESNSSLFGVPPHRYISVPQTSREAGTTKEEEECFCRHWEKEERVGRDVCAKDLHLFRIILLPNSHAWACELLKLA